VNGDIEDPVGPMETNKDLVKFESTLGVLILQYSKANDARTREIQFA
jgi:hypothetical protein